MVNSLTDVDGQNDKKLAILSAAYGPISPKKFVWKQLMEWEMRKTNAGSRFCRGF